MARHALLALTLVWLHCGGTWAQQPISPPHRRSPPDHCSPLEHRLSLSAKELESLAVRWPALRSARYSTEVGPTLDALQRHLHFTDAQLRQTVLERPQLLSYSAPAIELKLLSLKELEPDVISIKEELQGRPALLGHAFETNLAPELERRLCEALAGRGGGGGAVEGVGAGAPTGRQLAVESIGTNGTESGSSSFTGQFS